jgi:flavin reductase (DIM6/NTAB) family NADH-FMN oxidoreductase RutF
MEKVRVEFEKMYYGFPVVLVSFYDQDGVPNVTTISSTYTLKDMMVLGLSSKGYAAKQIKEVKDFVINIPDRVLESEISFCGSHTGHDVRKFDLVSLTPVLSSVINAPHIKECPISIECTLTDVIEKDYFGGITNIMAKIKGRIVAKDYLTADGGLDTAPLKPVIYYGDGKTRGFKYPV